MNLDWCSEILKINVSRSKDLKNDPTLKRRWKCLFISALTVKISSEKSDEFSSKFPHFSPTKIYEQKRLPNEHIFPSRSLEVKDENGPTLQNNIPTVNEVDD